MPLEQTWRWYGPNDPVSLGDVKQAGATGVVTALHEVPAGDVWSVEALRERKKLIEEAGLTWAVVESIPVHEEIKYGGPDRDKYIESYQQSIRNMGEVGVEILCYNFMPVVDWTRTDLDFRWPDGSTALRFDFLDFAAFDLHVLKRPGAEEDYSAEQQARARKAFEAMSKEKRDALTFNIIRGLPGSMCYANDSVEQFQAALDKYKGLSEEDVQKNLQYFLEKVVPVAEAAGVYMAIHPDDPPIRLFGLPRVVSTAPHVRALLAARPSEHNGLTLCVGSYASRADNDIPAMAREFAGNVSFIHLRNVEKDKGPDAAQGSFTESDHLTGDVDMYDVLVSMLREQQRRQEAGGASPARLRMPFRPDHGHKMLHDLRSGERSNPGYTAVGRLRGFAELRGLELGIRRAGMVPKRGAAEAASEEGKRQRRGTP